jgi:hypothetical protein
MAVITEKWATNVRGKLLKQNALDRHTFMNNGVEWGTMDSYSHGRGLKPQLTNGVGLVIRYGTDSLLHKGKSL